MEFVHIPIDAAQAAFRDSRDRKDDEIWVNMGAGGLGDTLLALAAVKGLKARQTSPVVYRIPPATASFVRLFDGYDDLSKHVHDEVKYDIPPEADARDWQINAGYRQEMTQKARITRLERYCRNIGVTQPVKPVLREPERILELGKLYHGAIVLCPHAAWPDREYPLQAWASLEALFQMGKFKTVVLGSSRERPTGKFAGSVFLDFPAEVVTSIIQNAACVIANDSGLAHLAGLLGVPAVVLCGWSIGERIYNYYESVTCLQGMLHCNGCWTTDANYDDKLCATCANLATLTPDVVIRNVMAKVVKT